MNKTKTITFGDKIFARVTRNGQTIYNFVSEQVASMTDLISQLRKAMKGIRGLVMIHIRNYHEGWGDERPLMLYAQKAKSGFGLSEVSVKEITNSNPGRMLFPWETH